ncbi:hypothetical protein [Teredinibacter haidensis]|uniref:hypothetical protein n=1 Tax=Teredinibacter haidensis TaxID=2731755 RepID=UPI00163C8302|nr:hypothetical protein [Teredinibacter haidensis]
MDTFLAGELNGTECQVYFFKGWTTYSHPVKPVEPISFSEALQRGSYFQARMCGSDDKQIFTMFEGVELPDVVPDTISKGASLFFYQAKSASDGSYEVGSQITANETLDVAGYYLGVGQGAKQLIILVRPKINLRYQYFYTDSGALQKVVIRNKLGKESVLNY